jgi:hypothetical protein
MQMTSNGKILNYKVVHLVESYNFRINFTSIRGRRFLRPGPVFRNILCLGHCMGLGHDGIGLCVDRNCKRSSNGKEEGKIIHYQNHNPLDVLFISLIRTALPSPVL